MTGGALDLPGRLEHLRSKVASAAHGDPRLDEVDPRHRPSAENLLHYLALRGEDVRSLQDELASLGLSSLGRSESHVLASIDAVRRAVASLAGASEPVREPVPVDFVSGHRLLQEHATALLGAASAGRGTRIMVTLPPGPVDATLVHDLVVAGAEIVRIRCGDGEPMVWAQTIGRVREAEAALGRTVPVMLDLAGPRPATGAIAPGPRVRHVEPRLDDLGRVVEPVRVVLTGSDHPVEHRPGQCAPVVDESWLSRRSRGDQLVLRDARRRKRTLDVVHVGAGTVEALMAADAYLMPGTRIACGDDATALGQLPPLQRVVMLHEGDDLRLVRGADAPADPDARPPRVACGPPELFDAVKVGHRVYFDDGLLGAVVESRTDDELRLWVTEAAPSGSALRSGVRVNLPDTDLAVPALTSRDAEQLPFAIDHAEAVAISFVRTAADVRDIEEQLTALGGVHLGLVLKIETPAGFANLPDILMVAMRWPVVGVMIARGDLALETGYVRLGEVQEEILWLCEAAHVPVIWATDVLDTLARTGRPSRAEITDAAASGRAECVMLNPGPYAVRAVDMLDDLLTRMAAHQRKKSPLLRTLHAWDQSTASSARR